MNRRSIAFPLLLSLGLATTGAAIFVRSRAATPPTPSSPEETHFSTGSFPGSVLVEDFNRDGSADLAVANVLDNSLTVLLGDGRGGFRPSAGSPFSAGHNPNDAGAGDFDGDGLLDLAFANHDAPYVTLLRGDGKGGFRPAPRSPFAVQSQPHPHGIAVGDWNGDRKLDLAVESWAIDKVEVLLGDGKGGFAIPGALFAVGRMPYQRLRAADLDGDGRDDLVTTNFEGESVSVLLADGKGGFRTAPGSPFRAGKSPFAVAIGDLDGDHHPDLAVANYSGQETDGSRDGVHVLLGDGKGGFRLLAGSPFPTGRSPVRIALGDLDGDGRPEIMTAANGSNDVTILRRAPSGGYALARTLAVGHGPQGLAIADLNGDGKGDLVVCESADNRVTIFRGPFVR
ncbi:MAG TPA: VCBS repeat-containing protein [Thermoanaerobaculia bacterium]|jgi:hypothetical protein|nr:VCBS repeat-containing protein [Thermoanaerobaculia bacterium]